MKNLLILLRTTLIVLGLVAVTACGQKGPLILDEVPTDTTQQPLENSTDEIPVVKDGVPEESE